ncbi:MAG: STAS domain-containing protein [Leptolyngbyaceae cyanobacterium MO_188.B28]|nr:STAS domain-containing protein [Leptolyngbyaceae cyanobacterium MO_188.B28]
MQNLDSSMTLVQPCGALNAANAESFQQALTSAISSQQSEGLLVDMSQVDSMDSSGLISLVSVLSLARTLGKRFSLCAVPPSVRIVFELTQLDRVFEMVEGSSEETLAA